MDALLKTIEVNGERHEVRAETLAELLVELDYADRLVGTAVNQQFIRKAAREATPIRTSDQVEILVPMQGG